jgi:hypothetical protein
MNKRLQVMMDDSELKEIQAIADNQHVSLAEWVRRALRTARDAQPKNNVQNKLEAVRNAMQYDFPISDIDDILGEIETGYGAGNDTE